MHASARLALLIPAMAAACSSGTAPEEAPDRADLSVRVRSGMPVWFRFSTAERAREGPATTAREVVREFSLTAGPRGADGLTECTIAFSRVGGGFTLPGGERREFDSSRRATVEALGGDLLRRAVDIEVAVAGRRVVAVLDRTGEVREVRGWAEAVKGAFSGEGAIAALNAWHRYTDEYYAGVLQTWRPPGPAKPAARGETWAREQVLWAGSWSLLVPVEHELRTVDAREATVASRGRSTVPEAVRAFAKRRAGSRDAQPSVAFQPEALEALAAWTEEAKAEVSWEATARVSLEDGLPRESDGMLRVRTAADAEADFGFHLERLPGPPPAPPDGDGNGGDRKERAVTPPGRGR